MVNRAILEERGVSAEAWKEKLVLPAVKKGKAHDVVYADEKLQALAERIKSRTQSGRQSCTDDWLTLRAVDLLLTPPFSQIAPTLLADIDATCKTEAETLSALKMYGLDADATWTEVKDPKSGVTLKKTLNVPAFYEFTINLVGSMIAARKAKIINDRNLDDLFDFEPVVNTKANRLKCSVLNSVANNMARQYNYLSTLDQAVHQMLAYGTAIMFTQENWHWEDQERVVKGETKKVRGKTKLKTETYCVKEGLRYFIPHPARCFYDRSHPVKTFNTETGCDWAGHWKILQFKELSKNKELWNIDRISTGDTTWWDSQAGFLNVFFNNCVINAPTGHAGSDVAVPDRETEMAKTSFYSIAEEDKSVCVFEYRERLIPKDCGLGDYEYPVWARFMVAGDGTIVFAEPLTHPAVVAWKDNGDEKLMQDTSMALKIAPFQYQLRNVASQYIKSVKQNLSNITMVDKSVLGAEGVRKIEGLGEAFFSGLNLITFDGKELLKRRDNVANAIYDHRFPQVDTGAIMNAMNVIIRMAERALNFSPQEVGQAASHEQSKEEIKVLGSQMTNTLQYLGIPVDAGLATMGRQIYEAFWNEAEDDFVAELPFGDDVTRQVLEDMGFEFVEEPENKHSHVMVKGSKERVLDELMLFSMPANTGERRVDSEVARMLVEFARDLANNPVTSHAVSADQFVALYNAIARYMKLDLDEPLKNTGLTPEKQAEDAKAQLTKLVDQVKTQFAGELENKILGEVKEGLMPVLQVVEQDKKRLDLLWQALNLPPVNGQPGIPQGAPAAAGGGPPEMAPAAPVGGPPPMPPQPMPSGPPGGVIPPGQIPPGI